MLFMVVDLQCTLQATPCSKRLAADLIEDVPSVTEHVLRELLEALEIVLEEHLSLFLSNAGALLVRVHCPAVPQRKHV